MLSSASSPAKRSPRVKPGGMDLRSLDSSSRLITEAASFATSSIPPGQNGTYPDFPRTKLLLGPGARSREVDVRPVVNLGLGI